MSTDGIGESLWQACVDQLAQELSEQQFNTWIKPLTAQVADDLSRMTVFVANRFKLDWIRAQYAGKIAAMAEKMYGQPVAVELALAPREAPVRSAARGRDDRDRCAARRGRSGRGTRRRRLQEPPEFRPHFRHPGRRHGQPHGARRRDARGRHAGRDVQPAFHLRRRRPGQDPPDARCGQPAAGRSPRFQSSLHPRRAVRLGCGQELSAQDFRRVQGASITRSTCC
jgi:hypothetical protein